MTYLEKLGELRNRMIGSSLSEAKVILDDLIYLLIEGERQAKELHDSFRGKSQ
jgi:hypothetical protein